MSSVTGHLSPVTSFAGAFPPPFDHGSASSCGDEFAAVGVDARLPFGLAKRRHRLFLE